MERINSSSVLLPKIEEETVNNAFMTGKCIYHCLFIYLFTYLFIYMYLV